VSYGCQKKAMGPEWSPMASIPPRMGLRVTFPKIKIKEANVKHFYVPQKLLYYTRVSICQGKVGRLVGPSASLEVIQPLPLSDTREYPLGLVHDCGRRGTGSSDHLQTGRSRRVDFSQKSL